MKFRLFLKIIIPMIIIVGLILTFFNITAMDVFKSTDSFTKKSTLPILSTHNAKTLFIIDSAFLTSEKMDGNVNLVRPDYILEINHIFNKKETVYLWINPKAARAMYLNSDPHSNPYQLSKKSTDKLKQIILSTNK